jgi:hypothetical protein
MTIRQVAATAAASAAAVLLLTGAETDSTPTAGGSVALVGLGTSLHSPRSGAPASQLVGQWQSDNGRAVLLLQGDGLYGYSVGNDTFTTAEQGSFEVNGAQLVLTPAERTVEINGVQSAMQLDPLTMSIGTDSAGNLVLNFNGSIYHKV